jgi:AraC family transcriptional regulator
MNPVAKAVWFIESHLAEDVTLADIAAMAGASRFHLVRAFGLATGVPVMRYVRIRRLSEAARALANGAPDILTVALDAGYTSHEAFTRAFREQFGLTPESTRARGSVASLILMEPLRMDKTSQTSLAAPRMEDGRSFVVAGLEEHVTFDNLAALPGLWQRVTPHLGHIPGQIGPVAYGVCHNTDENGFDYIAGVEVAGSAAMPQDFAKLALAPQRYAVFTHTDHVSTVRGTFMAIFNDWMPRLGLQSADAPVFERYDERFDSRTGMGGFEIWIPIRP